MLVAIQRLFIAGFFVRCSQGNDGRPAPTVDRAMVTSNVRCVAAGLHILGWLLAIAVIAAITRSFSRT